MYMNIKEFFDRPENKMKTTTPAISSYYQEKMSPVISTPAPVQYHIKDRNVKITDKDLDAMRPLIYGEISNRTPDKQALEANVIFNTALNRQKEYARKGQNKTLSDVIAMPNQYQAYGGPQYQEYHNPTNPVSLMKKNQVDAIVDNIREKIKKGEYIDNTEGAYYYIHEKDGKIKYDNLKKLFAN
jgi:hypothetical protein